MKKIFYFNRSKKFRETILAYCLMLPSVTVMVVLVLIPVLTTFLYSLKKMKLTNLSNASFIGLDNYKAILASESFWYSLQNSMSIMVLVVLFCCVCSIIMALMFNVDVKINNILIGIAIIPWALPPIVNGILWRWMFHPGFGFVNKVLINIGIIDEPINWLSSRLYLIIILSIMIAWRSVPLGTIILLSSIKAIPESIYEAASIDGAGCFQSFFKMTLPLLISSLAIVSTFTSITAINVFDEVVSLSGYSNIAKTLLLEDYMITFTFLDFGLGSAFTYIIILISTIFAVIYIKALSKKVHYI